MTDLCIGLLLFPEFTQLDLTGPYEVFRKAPGAATLLLATTRDPVRAETGMARRRTSSRLNCSARH